MKKITLALIGLIYFNTAFSQTYTTGLMELSNTSGLAYSIQIDVNPTTVTLTMIGPENRWLGLGFGVQSMTSGGDAVIFDGTTLTDRSFGFEGQEPGQDATGITPLEDAEGERDWTVTSNVVNSGAGVRTLIATRATNTGNAKDYVFSAAATSIELVWARARFEGFSLEWHGPDNRGITMQSLTLSQDDFQINDFEISPNPASNNFTISLPNFSENVTVNVYDVLGKEVYNGKLNSMSSTINVSQWNSGIYLVRVSTEEATHTKRLVKQ
ncbi:T9SS type A sorting domain-containing protein [Psychroserpens jangbogonensis]|uniref:T9SS type A sorting domain-containing protein n=1 Tax=Psychroserpens jangbogonensis TaxID=1484460 RepID=UPI00053EC64E|nr:T9SS type A sorting domain-containing protein [Psychroserpens jangbogonensis]